MVHRLYLDAALYECKCCGNSEEFYTTSPSLAIVNGNFEVHSVFFWNDEINGFSSSSTDLKSRELPFQQLYRDEMMPWTERVVYCKYCEGRFMRFVKSIVGKHKTEFEKVESEKAYKMASRPFYPPKNCLYDIMDETDNFIHIEPGAVENDIVIKILYPKEAEIYFREKRAAAEKEDSIPF